MAQTILNKCPVCGGKLYIDNLYQYSKCYEIGKRGKALKSKCKTIDQGPMEVRLLMCENNDFFTNYQLEIVEPANFEGYIDVLKDGTYLLKEEY